MMKKLFYISCTLILAACDGSSEDKDKLKNLNLTSMALSACITESTERFGYEYISDVEVLSCQNVSAGAFDQPALDEMSRFGSLTDLYLGYTQSPVHFDGSNFPALQTFRCDDCALESIDLSQNSELNSFEIFKNSYLTELDLSNNPKLEKLNLSDVKILNLNLGKQELLKAAYIVGDNLYSNNTLLNINLTQATALESLELYFVDADYIDLSNNSALISLDINYSNLQSIDVGSTKIQSFSIQYSDIVSLDTSMFTELNTLVLIGNQIDYIDLENNVQLELLNLKENPLSDTMIDYLESITWIERIVF